MREYVRSQYIEQFRRYEEWFNTGAIPQEYASGLRVAEDGIVSYGDYLYHKGENLEHYLANLGLTDQNPYPIRTCAYVDADGWRDNGWMTSDLTEGKRQAWHKEVSDFIAKQPDDALLVSVDCHT